MPVQGIVGMRALSSLSALRTNGYPLILVSGEKTWNFAGASLSSKHGISRSRSTQCITSALSCHARCEPRSQVSLNTVHAGARTSTVLQRLACLPLADALVSENGGRIYVHDPILPTAAKFVEDTDWCRAHSAA